MEGRKGKISSLLNYICQLLIAIDDRGQIDYSKRRIWQCPLIWHQEEWCMEGLHSRGPGPSHTQEKN